MQGGSRPNSYTADPNGWVDPLGLAVCRPTPVGHGETDLSRRVIAERQANNDYSADRTNYAAARIDRNGQDVHIVKRNEPGGLHSEQRLWEDIQPGDRIIEVYSERRPCSQQCQPLLDNHAPGADVTYSYPYTQSGKSALQRRLDQLNPNL